MTSHTLALKRPDLLRDRAFVAGEWQTTERLIDVTNPATGDLLARVPNMGAAETRAAIEAAAAAAGVPFHGFWLRAPLDVLRARVAARTGDASDATVAVLEAAAARDPGPVSWRVLDAAADPLPAARALLSPPPAVSC